MALLDRIAVFFLKCAARVAAMTPDAPNSKAPTENYFSFVQAKRILERAMKDTVIVGPREDRGEFHDETNSLLPPRPVMWPGVWADGAGGGWV